MPEALPQFADDVLAACKVGAEEAGAALARAFQGEVQIALGPQGTLQSVAPQLDLAGTGLIVLLKTNRTTVVVTIPAAKGLVPAWCAQPDPTGESKLATLAQELGMNLLPETWLAHDFSARWVANLGDALGLGGVPPDALAVPLAVSQRRAGQRQHRHRLACGEPRRPFCPPAARTERSQGTDRAAQANRERRLCP